MAGCGLSTQPLQHDMEDADMQRRTSVSLFCAPSDGSPTSGEIVDIRTLYPKTAAEATFHFAVVKETQFGDRVFAVGSAEALGQWDPLNGLELVTDADRYPKWGASVNLPAASAAWGIEYKFVVVRPEGAVMWEPGENRQLVPQHAGPMCAASYLLAPNFGEPVSVEYTLLENNEEAEEDAPAAVVECTALHSSGQREDRVRNASDSSTSEGEAEEDSWSETPLSESVTPLHTEAILEEDPKFSLAGQTVIIEECEPETVETEAADTEDLEAAEYHLQAGAFRVQKPAANCEDSYFYTSRALGIADGVGDMVQFASYGIDAAAFAAELMEIAARSLHDEEDGETPEDPSEAAVAAVAAAQAQAQTYGASTMLALKLQGNVMGIANLGDSGFMLLRKENWGMEIIEKSREQEHSWNCPYQLTRVPPRLAKRVVRFDSASDAQRYQLEVRPGDLVLLFSDGLTDNLHWYEILKAVNSAIEPTDIHGGGAATPAEEVAKALVLAAQDRSLDKSASTPFSQNARRHRLELPGGKVDDITVVAAWVASGPAPDGSAVAMLGSPHVAENVCEMWL